MSCSLRYGRPPPPGLGRRAEETRWSHPLSSAAVPSPPPPRAQLRPGEARRATVPPPVPRELPFTGWVFLGFMCVVVLFFFFLRVTHSIVQRGTRRKLHPAVSPRDDTGVSGRPLLASSKLGRRPVLLGKPCWDRAPWAVPTGRCLSGWGLGVLSVPLSSALPTRHAVHTLLRLHM